MTLNSSVGLIDLCVGNTKIMCEPYDNILYKNEMKITTVKRKLKMRILLILRN